ncbi:MAG: hypothetical protein Q7R85_00415 [bacterium]|nr:hypothetical protein [bacterium]
MRRCFTQCGKQVSGEGLTLEYRYGGDAEEVRFCFKVVAVDPKTLPKDHEAPVVGTLLPFYPTYTEGGMAPTYLETWPEMEPGSLPRLKIDDLYGDKPVLTFI